MGRQGGVAKAAVDLVLDLVAAAHFEGVGYAGVDLLVDRVLVGQPGYLEEAHAERTP